MSYIPGVEQAKELVMRYNKDPFHIQHAETVSKVMGELAKEFDPDRVDFWAAVGMLHDIDFELTGLIGAAALMRPTGISDMEVKSIKKKFKDKKFAAGCSRDVITTGAQMLGWELDTLFQKTLDAMRA